MSDQILLTGVRGVGYHGVFDHERRDGQEFVVDVVLDVDITTASASDDLENTVDYGAIAGLVHGCIVGEPFDLIETLAEVIADACLAVEGVRRVEVTVHKPSAPIEVPFEDVAIRIVRPRDASE